VFGIFDTLFGILDNLLGRLHHLPGDLPNFPGGFTDSATENFADLNKPFFDRPGPVAKLSPDCGSGVFDAQTPAPAQKLAEAL